jgi:hypothetical protein
MKPAMEAKIENGCDFSVKNCRYKGFGATLMFAVGMILILYKVYDLLLGLSENLAAGDHAIHMIFLTVKAIAFVLAALFMLFMSFLMVLFWSKDALVTFGEIRKQRNGWVTVNYDGNQYKIFKMVFGRTYLVPINGTGVTVIPTYNLVPADSHAFTHAFIRVTSTFATKIIRLAKSHLD